MPTTTLLNPISREVSLARRHLLDTGWSYRTAAVVLGCSFTQLSHVLTGRRKSRSLITRIRELPTR